MRKWKCSFLHRAAGRAGDFEEAFPGTQLSQHAFFNCRADRHQLVNPSATNIKSSLL
jgi:hypothetical protein